MILRPCDIVFVRGKGWASRAILRFQSIADHTPSEVSHVGIIVDSSRGGIIVEALSRVLARPMPEDYAYAVFRPKKLSNTDRDLILDKAWSYVAKSYGWLKIPLHALDALLGGAQVFRRLAFVQNAPICSWLVASSYQAAGLSFGSEVSSASPDDLWDFVNSRPDKFERVYQC